jgi:hypothetical protein
MPRLFHVKVIDVAGTRAVLALRIISAEQPAFYTGKSFALMLLYDPIVDGSVEGAPLGGALRFDDAMDADWLYEHLDDYIEYAVLDDVKNQPVTVDLEAMSAKQRRTFYQSKRAPSARFEIVATQPAWLAHLREGMAWDSAAFDAQR